MNKSLEKRSFYQKYKFSNKNDMVCAWRNFKNIFSKPLFTIIFRPNILSFVTYSILTGRTKVEFVIYWVLKATVLYSILSNINCHNKITIIWNDSWNSLIFVLTLNKRASILLIWILWYDFLVRWGIYYWKRNGWMGDKFILKSASLVYY